MVSTPTESFFSQVDGELEGVGFSNPQQASNRRRMLDVVNELHLTGVQVDIDLPVIAVIGSQSAGKSSLIESISGVTLPRASGTCTRSPTECRLSYSSDPWQCTVSLRILNDKDGRPLGQPRNEPFGGPIFDKAEVEDRIRRAQCAILNPSIDPDEFLRDEGTPLGREVSFSVNSICLQISGPDVEDLSFCDLPGLIASVGSSGCESDIELVKSLVASYIEKPSCIILLTVACETDFQNQGAHQLAKAYDPEGTRTIGVLTKPDRIPAGEEASWLRYIRGQEEPLTHGWYSVKQPDSKAIASGITWGEARDKERELVEQLSGVLSEKIAQRLPSIQDDLYDLLSTTDEQLNKLPKPPSNDALSEILHLLSTFSKGVAQLVEGTPHIEGLLQAIQPACDTFRAAIRTTEPDFRPYERMCALRDPDKHKYVAPKFLLTEDTPFEPKDNSKAIFIDDVMNRAREAVTRELPHHYPFVVTKQYITAFITQWQKPTEALFRDIQRILIQHIKTFVSQHFEQYPLLKSRVHSVVADYINASSDQTMDQIQYHIAIEMRPRAVNEQWYSQYREKFLGHYKSCRPKAEQPSTTFAQQFQKYSDSGSDVFKQVNKILNGLNEIGIPGTLPSDLAKLLPPDPYDAAIEIMAGVRAYFQVSYRGFTEIIPKMIDFALILGLDRDQALEKALRDGLGIGSVDGHARCKDYIKEPRAIADRRGELMKRRERLETARRKLAEVW
ncbi:P-loop containing nucleoside triphosphate hydrolase protein [Trametes meyenii]|nr:P-loop containing nucleoside triphosphate hydrolase protein [Trametes meyenii]